MAGLGERALDGRQNEALDDAFQNVVSGEAESLAHVLHRFDRPVALGIIARDHEVRRAAADVDAGDAQARFGRGARQRLRAGLGEGARTTGEPQERVDGTAEFLGDFAIEVDELHAARFVP